MGMVRFKTSHGVVKLKLAPKPPEPKKPKIKTGTFLTAMAAPYAAEKGRKSRVGAPTSVEEIRQIILKGVPLPKVELTDVAKEREKTYKEYLAAKPEELRTINIKYPLIPQNPRRGQKVFAYAHIHWDVRQNELVYDVIEPMLDLKTKTMLGKIKDYVQEKLDVDFAQIKKSEGMDYLRGLLEKAMNYFAVPGHIREVLEYYMFRDFLGLERIEPFLKDHHIEDVSCDGIGIPMYVYHRDPRFGSIKTNVSFETGGELDSFVNKLSEKCGKVISVANPLLDGTLPDGSRVQSTLGSDIARQGSNFTIRMFTENPMTPTDIIGFETADVKMMSYLWFLIEHGASILVSGGTATGKTTFLNVLSLFIKPQMKIVSIEDTAELRLPHPHWVPEVARAPISEKGAVDMFELLRESLRQRPDYIIVGEVRGKEAYVLFQQMAVGHPGLSTLHSENFSKLIDRLTTAPISLAPTLIQNLDLVLFLKRVKRGNKYLRRVNNVMEVMGYDVENNSPIVNEIFKWNPKTDKFDTKNKSALLKKVGDVIGIDQKEVQDAIEKRGRVLSWMFERNLRDFKKVGKVLSLFYSSQDALLERIEAYA